MNYIGSKQTLSNFIIDTVKDKTGLADFNGIVCGDLFAGTGAIGRSFKSQGATVTANDFMYFSYVLNKHLIENTDTSQIDFSILDHLNNLEGTEGYIYNNYCAGSGSGRNYFTDYNGKKCDAIRQELEKMRFKINPETYYMALACLIDSIDKCANTASVYGAFLKHIKKSAEKPLFLQPPAVVSGPQGKVYCADINQLINVVQGDILYLDPPYNARQYCSNYHMLETIARYDEPEISGVTGLRPAGDQKSHYCSRNEVAASFEDLIKKARYRYIFLSYNNEGLMSLETISEIMSRYGKYSCVSQEYRRFRADNDISRNIKADTTTEYLHCLEKSL